MASLTSDLASTALRSLGSLAPKEAAAAWRFKSNLHKLANTITTIRSVLVAHENQPQRHDFENLIERLKDAVHKADDLLDEFTTLLEWKKKLMKTYGRFIKEIGSSMCAKQVCKKQSPMKFAEKVPKIMKNVRVSPRKTINQPR